MASEVNPAKIKLRLRRSRKLLLDFFTSYSEEGWFIKGTVGDWSVNDILLHIVGWDTLLLSQAKEWLVGREPNNYNTLDEDEYNRMFIDNNAVKSKSEAINMFNKSTSDLISFLESLTDEEIKYAIENQSLVDLDLYSHDMEHYKELKKLNQ